MKTRADQIIPLPENVIDMSVVHRSWNGVRLDVISAHCSGRVAHHLCYETQTRVGALLEEVGSPCEPRFRENEKCKVPYSPKHMYFAPAGLEIWGYSEDMKFIRDAMITFHLGSVTEHLEHNIRQGDVTIPRLRFADDSLWTLIKLLSDAVHDDDPSSQLYGDGLTSAIVARLIANPTTKLKASAGLAPWQLRRVLDYLHEHLPARIELAILAKLTGLSQSHFSQAFRVSTGMAPYRWQIDARIRHAQQLLLTTSATLEQVAETTGFADAVHLGRTFRRHIGVTPIAWRRDRLS